MFPTRRTYAWLAIGVLAFGVYVSVLPFDLRPMPLDQAWADFQALMRTPFARRVSRANFIANVLLFVPVGFGLMGALLLDRTALPIRFLACLLILPISVAVSTAAEFIQVFAPGRLPSALDVAAQTIGCLIGMGTWVIAGNQFTTWLRAAANSQQDDRLARLLTGYAAAWTFVNLAPFDITLDPSQLARRYRGGLITVVPFGSPLSPSRLVWDALASTICALPLGALGLVSGAPRSARRHAAAAFGVGAGLVAIIEVAQIFIRSHAADITDVLFGWLGVGLGVSIAKSTLPRRVVESGGPLASTWSLAALSIWCLILLAYHWLPYDFTIDAVAIKQKLEQVSLLPFQQYQSGSDLNAFNDVLVKLGLSAPLGFIVAFVLRPSRTIGVRLVGLLTVGAACGFSLIEAGQFFLASRVPGPTDVYVGIAGTLLGLAIGRWLRVGP
jgi:VanZ family protein